MTVGDAILKLVEQLLEEKEKVVRLEVSQQLQLNKEGQLDKDQQQQYIVGRVGFAACSIFQA